LPFFILSFIFLLNLKTCVWCLSFYLTFLTFSIPGF
jgi:hypothetical protein